MSFRGARFPSRRPGVLSQNNDSLQAWARLKGLSDDPRRGSPPDGWRREGGAGQRGYRSPRCRGSGVPSASSPHARRRSCRCSRRPRADYARLRPQRHHQAIRRVRPGQRLTHRADLPAAPAPGVPAVLKLADAAVPRDLDLHLGSRQLRYAQDARDPQVAAAPPVLLPALHSDQLVVAEPSSSAGSPSSRTVSSTGLRIAALPGWRPTSASNSTSGTRTRSRSRGPGPPTTSSRP